ncbi:multicopper oxidase family protein [Pyrobaculum sp.]|uniref:multicopper oxidase family protein n=1 Tax=Pyrobaculum sp. TaxID=2004705 RepID=UPI00317B2D84
MITRRRFLQIGLGAGAMLAMGFTLQYILRTGEVKRPETSAPVPPLIKEATYIEATASGYMAEGVLNPTIILRRGQRVDMTLKNKLTEPTIVHWHGFDVNWHNDAHPSFAITPGESYNYSFDVVNRAGTYLYHPHPHGLTAKQFYMGQLGLVIVEDSGSDLGFKYGVNDLPLVISDRRFIGGAPVYNPTPMEMIAGFLGNAVLVNGVKDAVFKLSGGSYRLRLVNGSNARLYKLSIVKKNGDVVPMRLIAVDQGFLARPIEVRALFLAPAERAEVVVELGEGVYLLKNTPFDPMHLEMGHGMGHGMQEALPEGSEYTIATFLVEGKGEAVPVEALSDPPPEPPKPTRTRRFALSLSGMQWTINGMFWNASNPLFEHVSVEGVELWEIVNDKASMPHPMHLHGFPMWIIERKDSPRQVAELAVDNRGRLPTDLGLKDTVLIWPGETVKIVVNFDAKKRGQLFPFHCHNLEHEDGGMMINIAVK